MSDDIKTSQGSIIPTLIIGLGGAGSRIVDRLAGRCSQLQNWEKDFRSLTQFVSIDTNELDQHKLKHIPAGNRLNIAAFDKATVIDNLRRSRDLQALQWLDKGYQPRPGFKPGAGQIRVESRLGFFYHSQTIRQRLQELVDSSLQPGITARQSTPPKYHVYIFCSLAGGTGSGSFLSTAYLIDEIIHQRNWQPRVIGNFLLSTVLLNKVGPELHADIHANTYAALKELEHLTKLDYKQVKDEGRTAEAFVYCRNPFSQEITQVKTRPFFLSFIYDRPPHIELLDAEAAIADAAFLQIFTPVIDNLAGELDNYEKRLEELTRFPGDLRDVGLGYTKNFGACGAAALVLPGEDLLEYCALRFAAQALRRQITFSIDPTDADDDRNLILARLAVNYADPKFLAMADEGRERTINQSFIDSVLELARQDQNQELTHGFWLQLTESVDIGKQTGIDEQGNVLRNESLIQLIERKLAQSRQDLLNKITIRERAFVFHKEGVNQYIELVARLSEDIRVAAAMVGEALPGLELEAKEGELISILKLDPLTERYLSIRLLNLCEQQWLPDALQQFEKAKERDISNIKVRERLERELAQTLADAARQNGGFLKRFSNSDEVFLAARDEAQEYYRAVAAAARKMFDAQIRIRQMRALHEFLLRRSRQYANLSTRMDSLVQDLEKEAENLRRGLTEIKPALALRVEVFETLEEPRQRIWDKVYRKLFIENGRYVSTFDRQTLAETIARELKPVINSDGRIAEKTIDQLVRDLRRALHNLGYQRLKPAILGHEEQSGLNLIQGLNLEAELQLTKNKPAGQEISDDEITAYCEKKFRALSQLLGVFARVNSEESSALDDGVVANYTRQLILYDTGDGMANTKFYQKLLDVLSAGGKQVKRDFWHDPRTIIVHDVALPIPLYYFPVIIGDIEQAYLVQAANDRRGYNLHTDYNWENPLPNLNPRNTELNVDWSLTMLTQGLAVQAFTFDNIKQLFIYTDSRGESVELGNNLSSVLYHLTMMNEKLKEEMDHWLKSKQNMLTTAEIAERHQNLTEKCDAKLNNLLRREGRGELTREDLLDRPIFRALLRILKNTQQTIVNTTTEQNRYQEF